MQLAHLLHLALPALAAPAAAQSDFTYNWQSLYGGPPSLIIGPSFFDLSSSTAAVGLGDSIRLCYSIDITQGGRNETNGSAGVSWYYVTQAYGSSNPIPGIDIGPLSIHSQVSDDLGDDSCFSAFFPQFGTLYQQTAGVVVPGLIASTALGPIDQGFFWTVAFEFIEPLTPANTLGVDPILGGNTPLLAHFIYELQGPVNSGPQNRQYFIASTSESAGTSISGPGGVTNGNARFGVNLFGSTPQVSGAVSGSRWTGLDSTFGFLTGGTIFFATPGDTEFFGGVAFTTPTLSGAKNGNTGNGNADWIVSGPEVSEIQLRVIDRVSGAESPDSTTALSNPLLVLNTAMVLASGTPASSMLQSPLSWDDLSGTVPPEAGSIAAPVLRAQRFSDNTPTGSAGGTKLGPQSIHVNFDPCTLAFLGAGVELLRPFAPIDNPLSSGLFDYGVGLGLAGSSELGPITASIPCPKASGARIGLHAVMLQSEMGSGLLEIQELSSAKTAVLQ